MNMNRNKIIILSSVVVFLGGIFGYQYLSHQKMPPPRKPPQSSGRLTIPVIRVALSDQSVPVPIQGRVHSFERVDIFSEVNGIFRQSAHPFKEGVRYSKGELLASLDDTEVRLAVQGQRAAFLTVLAQVLPDIKIEFPDQFAVWQEYIQQFDPVRVMEQLPQAASDREKLFLASRNIQGQYYSIRSAEERLSRYRINAPFDGTLIAVDVQPGTLVRPGQRLGTLLRSGNYELISSIPVQDLRFIRSGQTVKVDSDDNGRSYSGRIVRIGDQIDAGTQMVPIYIHLEGGDLKEGMYLHGQVSGSAVDAAVMIPKNLLMNGQEIWAIQDSALVRKKVDVVRTTRQNAIVKGLSPGTLLAEKIMPGMYEGMIVNWNTPESDDQ